MKLLASSSRQLNRRETKLVKRLVKRQALNDPNCDRRTCNVPNCGKDFVAAALPGECCEKCVPWEYASSLGLQYPQAPPPPQPAYDPRAQQAYPYNQYPYNQPQPQPQPQQYQPQRVDVYIFGPEDGARVSAGQSIYFDCEVVSPYNQYAQPRWSRSGNQPLPYKVQSTTLPGNRKLARLAIPDATQSDAGRYECNGGTGNANDQASIDLQVTEGGYYPRQPAQPQPQPQPQPQYPPYDPYNQYPYNQPNYYPAQPQPQPQPQPRPQPQPQTQPPPQPAADDGGNDEGDEGEDAGIDEDQEPAAEATTTIKTTTPQASAAQEEGGEGGEDEGEYPEDYTENDK
ncbi:unnamed protein product [Adineta steineri]|uniref:Ig-like domain-containing protein n=2 Tax=Adineta steineri TaxID=433720 RepID=A0A814RTN3_9BILA|nr:unnamed protein product [Adineta steineri]